MKQIEDNPDLVNQDFDIFVGKRQGTIDFPDGIYNNIIQTGGEDVRSKAFYNPREIQKYTAIDHNTVGSGNIMSGGENSIQNRRAKAFEKEGNETHGIGKGVEGGNRQGL